MKMLTLVCLSISQLLFAQVDIKNSIYDTIELISDEVSITNNQNVLRNTKQRLNRILETLRTGDVIRQDRLQLICISKDNDNRSPWVFGQKDPRTLRVDKIPGSKFKDLNDCKKSLEMSLDLKSKTLACISKDNDGSNPWVLSVYEGKKQTAKLNRFKTIIDCFEALRKGKTYRRQSFQFCGSRDNDGSNPYREWSYLAQTNELISGSEHKDLLSCQNNL